MEVAVANNGTAAQSYFVRAVLEDVNGTKLAEYKEPQTRVLNPGSTTTVTWDHRVSTAEGFSVSFEVWTGTPVGASKILASAPKTGTVFITAKERVKFNQDENVVTNANTKVYSEPGLNSPEIDHPSYFNRVLSGTPGIATDGPRNATGAVWWFVRFDRGYEGWVQEQFLDKS
jgi:hypothetical protein